MECIDIDTTYIRPLLEHYESTNYKELTSKIRSIKSFKGIKTPYKELDDGYIPDLSDRYFTADFPYGLVIIKSFAMICQIKTPNIDLIIDWYQKITGKDYVNIKDNTLGNDSEELQIPQLYGIKSIKEIEKYYSKR